MVQMNNGIVNNSDVNEFAISLQRVASHKYIHKYKLFSVLTNFASVDLW